MTKHSTQLQSILLDMAESIEQDLDPEPHTYSLFFQHPEVAFELLDIMAAIEEVPDENYPAVYSACLFALDICIAQLQAATEGKNKVIERILIQLMNALAKTINTHTHSLSFWLPILNAFYEVHVELTEELKNAYFDLANQEDVPQHEISEHSHLDSIKDLINDLSDLSVFDITENFFAQSYAMPPDFMGDLVTDLYSIEEGQDIALLTLLHPNAEVREVVVNTLEDLLETVKLSSISLSRLEAIKHWYPVDYHPMFNRWIKAQRKKGVVFEPEPTTAKLSIKATEVDGSGSQGLFIHLKQGRTNRLAGLLLKYNMGVKDTWITPPIKAAEVTDYYQQAFIESVTLREIDLEYLKLFVEHFLAISIEHNNVVDIHFLELQELSGIRFRPKRLDLNSLFEELSVQIVPFTEETLSSSLKRSKSWLTNKQFTESWYVENPLIDKIVNHNSSFIDGVKICRLENAMEDVFEEELEQNREQWVFHFLWVALWFKAREKKNEKTGMDSFLIAYLIHNGTLLKEIPVMVEICRQTVINSVETMQERKTHLNKE